LARIAVYLCVLPVWELPIVVKNIPITLSSTSSAPYTSQPANNACPLPGVIS